MIAIPIHDTILLPDVTFFFKKETFEEWEVETLTAGDEIVFAFLKEEPPYEDGMPDGKTVPDEKTAAGQTEDLLDLIYPVGVRARLEAIDNEGNLKIRTRNRVDILKLTEAENGVVEAEVVERPEVEDLSPEDQTQRFEQLKKDYLNFVKLYQWGLWARGFILQWKNIYELVCTMAPYFSITWEEKVAILCEDRVSERYRLIEQAAYEFIEMARVHNEAEDQQKKESENIYRENALKKQIEILLNELDEMHPENISDVRQFQKKIEESGMNETARKEADKVLNRMKQEGQNGHEYGMLYDYLDFVTSLCWKKPEASEIDLTHAEEVLDADHYGLKKVKQRILQQLAVMALKKQQAGSILLFVGAPGTGKTSIGQSIAKALGREYVRISLGGIRDEAEIRGHRRTYIGAMPGRIMEGMKRSGASNPVMVLDEVDKLAKDYGGDPASALLEVLDPEQNFSFTDHYMNVPYDLSNVFFVCTANQIDTIPEPLLNRMEVIEFPGYSELEKESIARKHLIPKAYESMGIRKTQLKISDTAVRKVIQEYTMESGVRGLKKRIEGICRHAAVRLVKGEKKLSVIPGNLKEYVDGRGIHRDKVEKKVVPGIVTGLAWTAAGGEILYIETKKVSGTGQVIITGQLGDVMKESFSIAISLVKEMFPKETKDLQKYDLHIHVPEGAVPKDGPSAGITITTALASLFTGRKVDPTLAMTGEVSLRGNVMPIGGLPEKLMAAVRAGVKTVFIPKQNVEDLEDVPEEVKKELTITPVEKVKEVLERTGILM
ncbi:MAG: endopeptidase La [Eubacterium sp.]|nr:endopeptidase La [Eubacterium sp.]